MLTRRTLLKAGAATAAPLGMASGYAASLSGLTKLLVGFPAGASIDVIARRYANKLQGTYAETIIVDNRNGAAGRVAMEQLSRSVPDGRTLLLAPSPLLTLYPFTYKKLRYDPLADFTAIATVYQSSMGIAIGPGVPATVTNLPQFLQWAKAQKKPIFFSANAQGAGPHLMGMQFGKHTGIAMDYVPYQGGTQAMNALLSGDLPMICISMGTLAPQFKSGKMRVLASFDAERNPLYPEIPTLKEQGYPELLASEYGVLLAPAKLPKNLVTELEQHISSAMAQADLQESMRAQFLGARFLGSAATTAAIKHDLERLRGIVESTQFTPMD